MSDKIIRLGSEYALSLPANKLGESPICSPDGTTLFYVDVPVGKIHRYDFLTKQHDFVETGTNVSFVAPEAGRPGVVVAGVGPGNIHRYEFGTARDEVIAWLKNPRPHERSNDGKIDPHGVLVVGTKGADEGTHTHIGRLSWLHEENAPFLTPFQNYIHISQGPAWSPDGNVMYINDSRAFLWTTRYHLETSTPEFSHHDIFADMPDDGSVPDGLTTYPGEDGHTHVVLAKWSHTGDMGRVDVYRDVEGKGELVKTIEIPTVLQASSVIFGGPQHRDLIITTANYGKSEENPDIYIDAGKVFVLPDFAPGLPATPFKGKNFPALAVG